jgi:tetratricopeptide (TPR) repeat protein
MSGPAHVERLRAEIEGGHALAALGFSRLPPRPRCYGRDDEVETLVDALCAEPSQPVPVLGPGGIGKSTVTLAALHHRRVVERFGPRRWFVRCDGATGRDALVGEIAAGIGVEPGGKLDERVYRELERAPGALFLDNTEAPWEPDPQRVEELLAQLGSLDGLALTASIRGDQRPLGPSWTEAIRIGPLSLPAARDAFIAVAGGKHRNDPLLDRLLEAVDHLPLAVTLLAWQAEADPDLAILWERWQKERTELLRRGDAKSRLTSLEVSLELSIHSPRISDAARQLLSLLGILPDGLANEDLSVLLPGQGETASSDLRKVGLAFSQGARLRVLAPVREHAAHRHPPTAEDLERARLHYLRLAELGDRAGRENGAEAVQRVGPETGNLEAMILRTLEGPNPREAKEATQGMARLFRLTGLGAPTVVERALEVARKAGDEKDQALCLRWLGDIALYRSDHDAARAHYEAALPLFHRACSIHGEANCIWRLGDVALHRWDHTTAGARYEEALPLFQDVGDVLGEANCILRLGDIAFARSDHGAARACYKEALPLFRHVRDVLGEANCIKRLGDIAFARSDHDTARACCEEALPLYQRVGDVLGEANCIKKLGDIALARSDQVASRTRYEQAFPLYRRIGSVLGEANCIRRLGDIALQRDDLAAASAQYEEAMPLFQRIGDVLGKASCIGSLGDIALKRSDYATARARHEEVFPIYQRIGDVFGEANSIQSLGDIALAGSDDDTARSLFERALGLYLRIPDPCSIGWVHVRLARISDAPDERRSHIEAARAAWERIKRPDLIARLEQEFGHAPATGEGI